MSLVLASGEINGGTVAERLRTGLQIRVHRFESGRYLHDFKGFFVPPDADVPTIFRAFPFSAFVPSLQLRF